MPCHPAVMTGQTNVPLPSLAGADWLVRPDTQAVFQALANAGYEGRAVGGVVRNALMGLAVTDIDIATPALPEAVIAAGKAAGLGIAATGLDHGTVTLIANHVPHEVTTLRRDVSTDGRRATVVFTDDWAEDARRRDFTFNALYCDRLGQVHDPLGGYPDVLGRHVRFIGDADQRIAEDYLRILRFFRFHAVLGEGVPDTAGLAACIRGRDGLDRLSAERIRSELLRLLTGRRANDAIAAMVDAGLLPRILRRAPRPGVLASLIAAEATVGAQPDAIRRLSALAVAGEEDVAVLAAQLRLSNNERDALFVIDLPLGARFADLDERHARRLLYRMGPERWRAALLAAIAMAAMGSGHVRDTTLPEPVALLDLYGLPQRWTPPKLPVKGVDVIALGLEPGPRVGAILAEIEGWWIDADFPPESEVRQQLTALVAKRN